MVEGNGATFGAAAYAAGYVRQGYARVASRQDEFFQGDERFLHPVDGSLQRLDVRLGNDGDAVFLDVLWQAGQLAAQVEQGVLDVLEFRFQGIAHPIGVGKQSDETVQLVYRAVGFQPGVVLGYPGAAYQGGGAFVAGFGIYFHG